MADYLTIALSYRNGHRTVSNTQNRQVLMRMGHYIGFPEIVYPSSNWGICYVITGGVVATDEVNTSRRRSARASVAFCLTRKLTPKWNLALRFR